MAKELVFAGVTLITGDMLVDLIVGVITYSFARLFWWAFEAPIKNTIERFENFLRKKNK